MRLIIFQDWWYGLNGLEQVFWSIALVASALMLIQFIMGLVGSELEDMDLDHGDMELPVLSVRSILAFFTLFGWAGVLMLQNGMTIWMTLGVATITGFAGMIAVAYLMLWLSSLTEIGNLHPEEAIGKVGEVYFQIPGNRSGLGKVHLHFGGSLREWEAMTDSSAIETGAQVRVLEVLAGPIVIVEKIQGAQFV